jgi:aldose 1-epimerase
LHIDEQPILNKWREYTLINDKGMSVSILDYGGIITKIRVPDRNGNSENVVLGYRDYADYAHNPNFFGALIGPVAGRIQEASFHIGEKNYPLTANEGRHHLHGGAAGFHQVLWQVETFRTADSIGLKLTHTSRDCDGYPGKLDVTVRYILRHDNTLIIDYLADTDHITPVTLTNHSYFNLSGDLKHTVHHHKITMDSGRVIALDKEMIPAGRKMDVAETVFDFRDGREIAEGLENPSEQNKIAGNGYDHYFLFDRSGEVVVHEQDSGRVLTIQTNHPGMVMYTANGLEDGLKLAEGLSKKHLGVCFETQGPPASLNHEGLPGILLNPGETYRKQTKFAFTIDKVEK